MFSLKMNARSFLTSMDRARKENNKAVKSALNSTVYHISQKTVPAYMRKAFENPTKFTQRAFRYERAKWSGNAFKASVEYKYARYGGGFVRHYLETQVGGGKRKQKGFESLLHAKAISFDPSFPKYFIPSTFARMDRYGNVSRGVYNAVLADLQAMRDPTANRTKSSTKRNKSYRKRRHFFGSPKVNGLAYGVWVRQGKKLYPLFHAVSDSGTYNVKLDLERIEQRAAIRLYPHYLRRYQAKALKLKR